jgi:hypothetical protein
MLIGATLGRNLLDCQTEVRKDFLRIPLLRDELSLDVARGGSGPVSHFQDVQKAPALIEVLCVAAPTKFSAG